MKPIFRIFKLSAFILLAGYSSTIAEPPPNFVVILVDDLGWADVKCNYPQSFYDTPNIDALAKKGIRFTNAYAAHSVCSPTRAAIMTGKHPNRVHITDWIPGRSPKNRPLLGPQIKNELALEEVTLAEMLKEAGYHTFFAGKWHLGGEGYLPEDQGFDINLGGHHKGSPPGGYYSPYENPKLQDGPPGEYLTDRLTDESIGFLNEIGDEPFLLFLSYYTVHTPIQAAKATIETYQEKRDLQNLGEVPYRKEGEGWTKLVQEDAAYASMIAALDENVGRLLGALKEKGLDDNTWVIFTSDNGGLSTLAQKGSPTANGPLRAGKGWLYEGGIRVPLLIAGPGVVEPGRVVEQPAVSMDVFPTIVRLAGINHEAVDGVDLSSVFTQTKPLKRDALFWHYPHYHGSTWKPGSALRKDDWKLVVFYEDNRTELFNLADDPGETTDLSSSLPKRTTELKNVLDIKLKESQAQFPTAANNVP